MVQAPLNVRKCYNSNCYKYVCTFCLLNRNGEEFETMLDGQFPFYCAPSCAELHLFNRRQGTKGQLCNMKLTTRVWRQNQVINHVSCGALSKGWLDSTYALEICDNECIAGSDYCAEHDHLFSKPTPIIETEKDTMILTLVSDSLDNNVDINDEVTGMNLNLDDTFYKYLLYPPELVA
jgi:hypothetical protein